MDKVTKEQYTQLREKGYSPDDIRDLANRGRIYETVNKQTFKEKGLLRATAGFLNMDEFGRGIGQTISNFAGTQNKAIGATEQSGKIQGNLIKRIKEKEARGEDTTRLKEALKTITGDIEDSAGSLTELGTGGLNSREVIGSAASTALNVASFTGSLPSAGGPVAGQTVRTAALRGAGYGALSGGMFGAAEGLTEGKGIAQSSAKGAAMGGAVGGVVGGVSQYIDDLSRVTPESRLYETKDAFKTLKKKFADNSVYKNGKLVSDPITTISDPQKGVGNKLYVKDGKIQADQAREHIRELIREQADDVSNAVTNPQVASTPVNEFKDEAIEMARQNLKGTGKTSRVLKQIDSYFDDFATDYGDDIATKDISFIREQMNKSFNPDTVDVERTIGDAARKIVYKNAPGAQEALAKEGQLIAADKFLDALDGRVVKGGRLGGYFANMIGAMAGSTTDVPVVGPVAGALGANQIAKFMQSQQLNPIAPQMVRGISTLVDKLPTDAAGNISKTAVLNLIGQLSAR